MSLDTKLRKLREQKGWSQMDVAHQLDISQSAYNKWESGKTKPTLLNLKKLASIFEINFQELIHSRISNEDIINLALKENSLESNPKYDTIETSLYMEITNNQQQISKLMKEQSKLIEELLKNRLLI